MVSEERNLKTDKYLDKYPDSEYAAVFRGRISEETGDYESAIKHFKHAIAINPKLAIAHVKLGELYWRENVDLESAKKCFKTAIDIDFYSCDAYHGMAQLCVSNDDVDEAIRQYELVGDLNPGDERAQYALGTIYEERLNDYDRAMACYERAIEINSQASEAYMQLGNVLYKRLNEVEVKRVRLEEMLFDRISEKYEEHYPEQRVIDMLVQYFYVKDIGNYFESAKNKKVSFKNTNETKLIRSNIHFQFGVILEDIFTQCDLAKDEYKKAIELNPRNSSAHYRLSNLLDNTYKHQEQAEQEFEKALKIYDEIPREKRADMYGMLGSIFYNEYKDYSGSKRAFEKQVEANDNDAFGWYNLAVVLRDKFGEEEKGNEFIEKAKNIDENIIGKLRDIYEARVRENPEEASEIYELGMLLKYYLNEPDEGQILIDRALQLEPDYLRGDM